MAASTSALAFGGPDRLSFEPPKVRTVSTQTETTAPPADDRSGVRGWLHYDPQTENFRQSSVDERRKEEDNAAQNLVKVCEHALDAASAGPCGYQQQQESSLLRSSFSFVVRKASVTSSPSASPFSGGHGKVDISPPLSVTNECHGSGSQQETSKHPPVIINGSSDSSQTSSSTLPSLNNIDISREAPRMMFLPPPHETRLGSHRGSVMEAGVILDDRVFGGIEIVQDGRKVGVRRSQGGLRLKAGMGGTD